MSIGIKKRLMWLVVVIGIILPSMGWGGYPSPAKVASEVAKNYKGLVSFKVKIALGSPLEGWTILFWQGAGKGKIEVLFSQGNSTNICLIKISPHNLWQFFSLRDFISPYDVWRDMGISLLKEQYLFFRHRPVLALGETNSTEASVFVDIEDMVELKKTYRGGREIIFDKYINEGNYLLPSSFEINISGLSPLKGDLLWEMVNEKIPPQVFQKRRGTYIFPMNDQCREGLFLLLKYFPSLK